MFSSLVSSHWIPQGCDWDHLPADQLLVVVDTTLPANRSVSIIETPAAAGILSLSPGHAEATGFSAGDVVPRLQADAALTQSGVVLNDPDHVYYLSVDEQSAVSSERATSDTRQLTPDDAEAFARFTDLAPADDLDEAFVELDHWLVFGTFVDGHLVCAASMYPWAGTRLADLGVITLPDRRGKGYARATVRAMSAHALAALYEPQYRCQTDNEASIALARAAGFERFGTWHVIEIED